MALQYSYLGLSFKLSMMKGLILCLLLLLINASSSFARLLTNTTNEEVVEFREQHRRAMLANGLGRTPPMG
jgi:hypothetical protein